MGKGNGDKTAASIRVRKETLIRLRLLRPYAQLEGWNQSDEKIINKIIDFFVETKGIKEKGLTNGKTKHI